MPIMRSLYRIPQTYPRHYLMATILLPKDELSKLVCFFDIQYTGAMFTYIIYPLLDRRVTVSPAWSASTLDITTKLKPHGEGMFGGISYLPDTWQN